MFSQSGALGSMILADTARRGLGLSTFISAGNRADVSGNDMLQYWEEDEATDVVLLYLESFGNPHKFARLARRISARKPIVVVRSARSAPPVGHRVAPVTLAAAAEDDLFRQAGVVRVDTLSRALDVATLLEHQPLPTGSRVAVVGNSHAVGVLAADACAAHGLDVAGGGPVDLGAHADVMAYDKALQAAIADSDVDAVVVVFVPPLTGDHTDISAAIAASANEHKPVLATFLGHTGLIPNLGGVPSFDSPETAVDALAAAIGYAEWRARPVGALPDLPDVDIDAVRRIADGVLDEVPDGRRLDGAETSQLLDAFGVHVWTSVAVRTRAAALTAARRLGWPVAVKAAADHLRRRIDLGGVRLDIRSDDDLKAAYDAIVRLGSEEVLVQRMAPPGVAVSVEAVEDRSFGVIVRLGVGGLAT
jgi:acyl-CoA synthetase (NDP forming)